MLKGAKSLTELLYNKYFALLEDLWTKAEQRLVQDTRMARVLKEASWIVKESGLKLGSHETTDHQQQSFLDAQVKRAGRQKMDNPLWRSFLRSQGSATRILKNILVVKDLVNT